VRMASHTHCAQVERLEVVDTGRRRRWSEEEKLRIVAESLSGPRLVSAIARRYGISTWLLFRWRRACRQSTSQPADTGFVPAVVVLDFRPAVPGHRILHDRPRMPSGPDAACIYTS
jgi:transposase